MPYKLSPSTLSLLSDCPRCFWLHFHGVKRPTDIFPSLPSGMDRILKVHFDDYASRGLLPPEVLLPGCTPFDDVELLKVWRNNLKGVSFTDASGNVLHGAVDNILMHGKKLIVLDYKTRGYPLKDDTASHYVTQMEIYNYLLRKNGFDTEDYAYLLFYHPSNVNDSGDVIFNKDLVTVPVSVANAEKLWERALKILDGEKPLASEECEWCGYSGK